MAFPSTLDSLNNPTSSDNQGAFGHANLHSLENDAIEALEAKVGVDNSAVTTSLDYLVKSSSSTNPGHKHPVSAITQDGATLNQVILWDGSSWAPGTPTGGGNVTGPSSSIASEIALYDGTSGTTIKRMTGTGLVKVTSGVASVATPATDYVAPGLATSSGITIGTAKILGRTTASTGAVEEITPSTGLEMSAGSLYARGITGEIKIWSTSTAPTGFLTCDGSAVSRTTYSALFAVVGTTYGAGNGTTTFNLPNLKGKVVVGLDSSQTEFDAQGETGGEKTHTLTINEMPAHGHDLLTGDAGGGAQSKIQKQTGVYNPTWETKIGAYDIVGSKGGGSAHNNLQPYIVLTYIIKT